MLIAASGKSRKPTLHDGVEHRLSVGKRTADHLKDLRGRRPLLQRFGEIVGALAQLIEQPRVLDSDHGLRCEVRNQFDLLVGEGPHLLPMRWR